MALGQCKQARFHAQRSILHTLNASWRCGSLWSVLQRICTWRLKWPQMCDDLRRVITVLHPRLTTWSVALRVSMSSGCDSGITCHALHCSVLSTKARRPSAAIQVDGGRMAEVHDDRLRTDDRWQRAPALAVDPPSAGGTPPLLRGERPHEHPVLHLLHAALKAWPRQAQLHVRAPLGPVQVCHRCLHWNSSRQLHLDGRRRHRVLRVLLRQWKPRRRHQHMKSFGELGPRRPGELVFHAQPETVGVAMVDPLAVNGQKLLQHDVTTLAVWLRLRRNA
mmetsp:Transcript_87899/g.284538  ORF Transcript_87899/g.284538 Transcript_87899/m.284538 type:complete len:278 (-) Transcript_87899:82-915(-)